MASNQVVTWLTLHSSPTECAESARDVQSRNTRTITAVENDDGQALAVKTTAAEALSPSR
jgi:hypothetical protein